MRQNSNKLTNVKSYKELESTFNSVEEPAVVFDIERNEVRENVISLLGYEGVDLPQIPGSLLGAVADITGLSVSQIIDILHISKSTFYRIKDENFLESETIDKLASLFKIYNKGINVFGDRDDFYYWLESRVISLGNKRPIDLIKTENGRSAVLDAINRIAYGIYG